MTLVIACKSKDGIVVASDGKGTLEDKFNRDNDKVSEDVDKIFLVGECLILAYGDGVDDYNAFFKDYEENADYYYKEYKDVLDYEFCARSLPSFLKLYYEPRIKGTERRVGLALVGSEKGVCKIQVMDSSIKMFQPHEAEGSYAGGVPELANRELAKIDPVYRPMSTTDTANLLRQLISDTADSRPEKVNKNIVLKLVSNTGIIALD